MLEVHLLLLLPGLQVIVHHLILIHHPHHHHLGLCRLPLLSNCLMRLTGKLRKNEENLFLFTFLQSGLPHMSLTPSSRGWCRGPATLPVACWWRKEAAARPSAQAGTHIAGHTGHITASAPTAPSAGSPQQPHGTSLASPSSAGCTVQCPSLMRSASLRAPPKSFSAGPMGPGLAPHRSA